MITRKFNALLRVAGGVRFTTPPSVPTTLSYDAGTDPYAVQAVFDVGEGEERVWLFSLELLSAGAWARIPVGRGDVKFRHIPAEGAVVLCLQSDEGHCDLELPHPEVTAFLAAAEPLFTEATKDCSALIDGFLREVFG